LVVCGVKEGLGVSAEVVCVDGDGAGGVVGVFGGLVSQVMDPRVIVVVSEP
jgi:hypothetical protein